MNNKSHAMMEAAKRTRTPKVRFPEFRDAEGWKETELLKIASPVSERAMNGDGDKVLSLSGEHGIVLQSELFGKKVAGDNAERYIKIAGNDFVYNDRTTKQSLYGTIKRLSKYEGGIVSPIYKCFRFNSEENPVFWDWYFESGVHESELGRLVNEGARAGRFNISIDKLLSTNVWHASIFEQQKIAECLTSLDELIVSHGQKLDALKTHKRGLMQQLFPRAGETHPRLRFNEFQDQPKWEEVALEKIAEIKLGKMLDSQKHTTGRLLPYLNNASVRWNNVDTSNLPQMYFDDDELERFGLRTGDVVVCEGGEPGRAAVWDGRLPDLKFQKAIHRVRFNVPFEPRFLALYLEAIAGTTQFEMLFTGGGIKHLTRETFAQLKIPDVSHAEQKRITSCLSSLDDMIFAQTQKLDALKTHKKGLMQQLFPPPEEVDA